MKYNILITGSDGFVGKKLCQRLIENHDFSLQCIDIKDVDLTRWENVKEKIQPFDKVVHLAAVSYVPDSYKFPRRFYETNILSTLNILELCKEYNAGIIFASSYVYGKPQYLPIDEEHPIGAINPYAESKIIGERLCKAYHRDFGIKYAIIRPSNIYGKGQNSNFLIPTILNQLSTGNISLQSSKPKRDFIHIDDIISFYEKVIKKDFDSIILNAGSGKSISVEKLVEMILSFSSKTDVKVYYKDQERKNEVLDVVYDISRAGEYLGWKPEVSLEKGITSLL